MTELVRSRSVPVLLVVVLLLVGDMVMVSPPAAEAASECPPNSEDITVQRPSGDTATGHRCVAELLRRTRGYVQADCVLEPRAIAPTNPLYYQGECKGGEKQRQAEAIAQARAIARLNAGGVFGDSAMGGITANEQWEAAYAKPEGTASSGVRLIDLAQYDRVDTAGPIELVELKRRQTSKSEDHAEAQLSRYINELPRGAENRIVKAHMFEGGYRDYFRLLWRRCEGKNRFREVDYYDVESVPGKPGILMIDEERQYTPCPKAGEPQLEEPPEEEPRTEDVPEDTDNRFDPPPTFPLKGQDQDGNGKDDWADFLDGHPRLDPLRELEWPSVEELPDHAGVTVDEVGAVLLFAGVTAFLACLAATAGICAGFGAAGLVAANGSISVGAAVAALTAAVGPLVVWNVWGDPHLVTLDRMKYDLQSVGEFHLLELPEAGIDVQARFRALGDNLSVLERVATQINDHRVEIGDKWVRIDGELLDLADGEAHLLGDNALLTRHDDTYVLMWPGDSQRLIMMARGNAVGFHVPDGIYGEPRGLLGNADGDPSNDLALRDGTPLPSNTSPSTLHGPYADSWRIADDESLLTYGPYETTATYTDLSAPANVATFADFTDKEIADATEICVQAGVQPGPQFDGCILDVAATGDASYAEEAAGVTGVVVSPDALGFGKDGRIEVDFEGEVPPNFRSTKHSEDAATSRVAGPLFDGTGYRFWVREVVRHEDMVLESDVYAYGPVSDDEVSQSVALKVNGYVVGEVLFDGGEPRLSNGMSGTIVPAGDGVTAGGRAFSRFRLTVPLGIVGESLNVELTPTNFTAEQYTSLAVDNIVLAADRPPAQQFSVMEPVSVPGDPGSGIHTDDGAGVLETPGAGDVYEFVVPDSQADRAHVINTRECSAPLTYTLTSLEFGGQISRWANTCDLVITPELSAGSYALTMSSYASTTAGTYAFDLLVHPEPQRFSYTLGQVVTDGDPIPGAGNLETVVSQDIYEFDFDGGGLYLDTRSCVSGAPWELRSVDTDTRVSSGNCSDWQIDDLAAGRYEFSLSAGRYGDGVGGYSFQLFATPVTPEDFTVPFPATVADQVPSAGAGNLETKLSVDRYAFTVNEQAPLYLDFQTCLTSGALTWKLTDLSSDSAVATGDCADIETDPLPRGSYRLDVASIEEGIGPYALQAWLVPLEPEMFEVTLPATISPDIPRAGAGNLETKVSQDVFAFSVPEGQSAVYVDQVDCSTPDMLTWRLDTFVDDLAVTVADGTCEDQQIRQVAKGDYQLVVNPVGESHGTYSLRIVASETGSPAILHAPHVTAYYGQTIPIEVTTTCHDPASCSAQLHYRTTTSDPELAAGSWATHELTATNAISLNGNLYEIAWVGTIHGAGVTTNGVDYYITAADGSHRNELPTAAAAPLGLNGSRATVSEEESSIGADVRVDADSGIRYLHVATISPPLLTHVPPVYAHADRDLPLEVQATCSTDTCTATLHYRISEPGLDTRDLTGDPGWPTITMDQTASTDLGDAGASLTYRATIPSSDVDTQGLDYYIDVTDGHTTSYWPGTTYQGHYVPRDGMRTAYQTVHVLEPPHVTHRPALATPYRADIPITATATCPVSRTCTATLYYRTTTNTGDIVGDSALYGHYFVQAPMNVAHVGTVGDTDLITVAATVPAFYADTRGVDYFFRIDDGSTTAWWPGTGQAQGYVNVDGTSVAYQHIRVLEPPHITPTPLPATQALQPYTITSRMTCVTQDCSQTLHWRGDHDLDNPDGWNSIEMTTTGEPVDTPLGLQYTFTATIPSDQVTTRGLAYYLEGHDGHVRDFSPGTTYWGAYLPRDDQQVGAFIVRVLEPPHVGHVPPTLVEAGQPLTVTATSNCSTPNCSAILTWSDSAGQQHAISMSATKTLEGDDLAAAVPSDVWEYVATIPGHDTNSPVEYRIDVTDGYVEANTPTMTAFPYESAIIL